jgi:hypothetical protein
VVERDPLTALEAELSRLRRRVFGLVAHPPTLRCAA